MQSVNKDMEQLELSYTSMRIETTTATMESTLTLA